jgi:hypothetical protein
MRRSDVADRPTTGRQPHLRERGAVGIAIVIVLVILQLVIVIAVVAGSRDQNLIARRMETQRALYATEAGVNMAVRELMKGVDYDGDGGIGTISNDGNSANNPVIGAGSVSVSAATSGSQRTLTSVGVSGAGRRTSRAVVNQVSVSSPRTIVYGDPSTNLPRYRTWSGSAWSSSGTMLNVGGNARWAVLKKCPFRNEVIAAFSDAGDDINAMVYDGSTWGSLVEATTNLGTNTDRPFYFAYEQSAGDGLLVYRSGAGAILYYRTWNGTAWSAQNSVSIPGSGDPKFVKLVPKPNSNEIMLICLDSANDVSALVWNGTSFGNSLRLESSTFDSGNEQLDAAYERSSGRCMIAWSRSGTNLPAYRIWSGSAWLSQGSLTDVGGSTKWLRLAADPAGNKIIAATLDGVADVNVQVWSGSSWGSVSQFETAAVNTDRRNFDLAFEPAGTRALLMWGRSSQQTPFYRVYSGSSWSAEAAGPALGSGMLPSIIQMVPSASGQEIMIAILRRSDGALWGMRWNGSAIVDTQTLAADVAGPNSDECFMISDLPWGTAQILSWTEVAP